MKSDATQESQPTLITRQDLEQRKFTFMINDLLPALASVSGNSSTASSSPVSTTESDSSNERDSQPQTPDIQEKSNKSRRTLFSNDQLNQLEQVFTRQQYVGVKERSDLAARLGMTDNQIKVWFQNRRMKRKRKRAEETAYYSKLAYMNTITPPQPGLHGYNPYTTGPSSVPSPQGYLSPVPSPQVYLSPVPSPQGYRSYHVPPPPPMYGSYPAHVRGSSPPPAYPGLPVLTPGRECTRPDCNCGGVSLGQISPHLFEYY